MKKIDPESKQFIKWTMQKLENEAFFEYLISKINAQMQAFYFDGSRKTLLKNLRVKMESGALEHGKPKASFEEIKSEIEAEYLDLIGWSMIHLWNFEKTLEARKV